MGNISVSLPSDGTTADVADYNTPITTIVNAINGELDNTNIASDAAIAGSKLADSSVTASKIDLSSLVSAQEDWQTPTFINSWTNFGTPYAPARYMKDSLGFVHIEGLIKSGTNETIFNLPAGYRPATDEGLYFAVPISGGYGDLVIASNGNVQVYGPGRSTYASITCSFRAGA